MLRAYKERRDEEGFTLIELMVVVLIIGILLAIAVPTFLTAQNNAKNKAATSNLRTALSGAKVAYTDNESYLLDQATLKASEPSVNWVATTSADPNVVGFANNDTVMAMTTKSKNNICYFIVDNVASVGGGTTYAKVDGTSCSVAVAADGTVTYTPALDPADNADSGTSPGEAGW